MNDSQPPTYETLLPLSPTVFHILLALADEERHGYAIMQQVEADSGNKMGPGTLYGAIKRMLKQRLIEESEERPDPMLDDERRRYYRLTPFGHGVLVAETDRLTHLVELASIRQALLDKREATRGA